MTGDAPAKQKAIAVADGEGRMCGHAVVVKRTKRVFLCYTCLPEADGA